MRRSLSSTSTDVQGCAPERASVRAGDLVGGAAIINARGVPGTLAFLAVTRHDRRVVLVTSHHVLFGAGAGEDEPVWLAGRAHGARTVAQAGRVAYGRAGLVRVGATEAWVDCAAASIDTPILSTVRDADAEVAARPLTVGARVTKNGAATGRTEGIVAEVDYADRTGGGVRQRAAPGQILVRPAERGGAFCAAGDSGAALRDERGQLVGLVWGVTPRGEGVACPIAPVLHVLHVHALPEEPRAARGRAP
jgi:hypothetical protein